jgi:hypothetical protein
LVYAESGGEWHSPEYAVSVDEQQERLSVEDSVRVIKTLICFLGDKIRSTVKNIGGTGIGVMSGAGLVIVLAGYFLPRVIAAATSATLGTLFISVGMVILLLYKTAKPLSIVYARPNFYVIIAGVMIVFGTASTLLLCTHKRHKADNKEEKEGGKK